MVASRTEFLEHALRYGRTSTCSDRADRGVTKPEMNSTISYCPLSILFTISISAQATRNDIQISEVSKGVEGYVQEWDLLESIGDSDERVA